MIYRKDKLGNDISLLGYGCMRFTRKGAAFDYEKAEKEVLLAIEGGVNYFDTAYLYLGSEELLGKILAENKLREKVKIATKLPQYLIRTSEAIDKTFREELSRLKTDYVDFYLMHMMTDIREWEKLKALGIEEWIAARKAEGSIRQIGFSFHGNTEEFLPILDAYPWDFCQIQYNYLDENSQAGRRGLKAAGEWGIPVVIMVPLRGGKLVNMLPKEAKEVIAENKRGYTAAEWSFRWLYDQPEIMCVLSGMNSEEMVRENIKIASDAAEGSFTDEDREAIDKIRSAIKLHEKVGCTGCRYCMPCPAGVDIPQMFYYYNLAGIEKLSKARKEVAMVMGVKVNPGFADKCIKCGKCEQHCPQHINIREMLGKAEKELRPPLYRFGTNVLRRIMLPK